MMSGWASRGAPAPAAPSPPAAAFVYIFPGGALRRLLASLKELSGAQSRLMSLEMRPLISFQIGDDN